MDPFEMERCFPEFNKTSFPVEMDSPERIKNFLEWIIKLNARRFSTDFPQPYNSSTTKYKNCVAVFCCC